MTIAAMKQALEAIQIASLRCVSEAETCKVLAANTALRAAIEQAEKCEPVAWLDRKGSFVSVEAHKKYGTGETKLYTHPAPVPAGWQLVPVEPTEEMLTDAGTMDGWDGIPEMADKNHIDWYKAMLQAAPKPGEMK